MGRGSTLERAALSSFSGQLWTGLGRRRSPCCLRVTWKVTGTGALPQPRPEAPALTHVSTFSQLGPGRRIPPVMAMPRARKPPQRM